MPIMKSAILFHPGWTYSHLCDVPIQPDGGEIPVQYVMHKGELFVRNELADQHDRQGRVAAYQFTPFSEIQ